MHMFSQNVLKSFGMLLLLFLSTAMFAQADYKYGDKRKGKKDDRERIPAKNRIFIGGSAGLGYSNGFNINFSPYAGYRVTDWFHVGAGPNYNYFSYIESSSYKEKYHVYGGRAFARFPIIYNLFVQAEAEYLKAAASARDGDGNILAQQRYDSATGFLVGGGYSSNLERGVGFSMELLYNVLYDPQTTPYSSPLIYRAGFYYGF